MQSLHVDYQGTNLSLSKASALAKNLTGGKPDEGPCVPHISTVGDVIGGYMLAHTAATQGRVAAVEAKMPMSIYVKPMITGETEQHKCTTKWGLAFYPMPSGMAPGFPSTHLYSAS